jgi:hypothetical protein
MLKRWTRAVINKKRIAQAVDAAQRECEDAAGDIITVTGLEEYYKDAVKKHQEIGGTGQPLGGV